MVAEASRSVQGNIKFFIQVQKEPVGIAHCLLNSSLCAI